MIGVAWCPTAAIAGNVARLLRVREQSWPQVRDKLGGSTSTQSACSFQRMAKLPCLGVAGHRNTYGRIGDPSLNVCAVGPP
jgi:hypothetical protein